MYENELYHHGVRGQKWGVRRYQNADGSLTAAGKRKYLTAENFEKVQAAKANAKNAKAQAKADARTQKQIDKINEKTEKALSKGKDPEKAKAKALKDMSNEEIQAVTNRMNLETNYLNAKRNLANATPKDVNKGAEFIKEIGNDVIKPAAKTLGRSWLEKKGKELLGLDGKEVDEFASLKKAAEKAGYEKTIYDAADKKFTYENKVKNAQNKSKTETKSEEKTETKSETSKKENTSNYTDEMKKSAKEHGSETYDNTVRPDAVIGKGTSKASEKYTDPKSYEKHRTDFVDAEFVDLSPSSTEVAVYKSAGQSYINQFLLEDKHGK